MLDREAIETIEAIIANKGIAEVKIEKQGITVVEISRVVKYPKKNRRSE